MGRYLAVAFERAGDYEALLKAAVDGGRLVRLAYNNNLNGNARQEILGKLIAVSNDGLNYRFQFSVYDSATGLFAAPVSMASLGYTAGSQGVLFGPAYGLAGATARPTPTCRSASPCRRRCPRRPWGPASCR